MTVRRIACGMNDASVPRALGRRLADRGRVPFLDRLLGPVLERWEKKQGEGPL